MGYLEDAQHMLNMLNSTNTGSNNLIGSVGSTAFNSNSFVDNFLTPPSNGLSNSLLKNSMGTTYNTGPGLTNDLLSNSVFGTGNPVNSLPKLPGVQSGVYSMPDGTATSDFANSPAAKAYLESSPDKLIFSKDGIPTGIKPEDTGVLGTGMTGYQVGALGLSGLGTLLSYQAQKDNKALAEAQLEEVRKNREMAAADMGYDEESGTTRKGRVAGSIGAAFA